MTEKDFNEIVALLGIQGEATPLAVSSKISELIKAKSDLTALQAKYSDLEIKFAGKETEVSNLQTKLGEVEAALNKYKDAEAAALKAEIEAVVDKAIADGKIKAEAKESWIQMANTNFDTVKNTLSSIEGRKVLTEEIAGDLENQKNAQKVLSEAEEKVQAAVTKVVGDDFKFNKL
jgi:chromosome segregation ATPase